MILTFLSVAMDWFSKNSLMDSTRLLSGLSSPDLTKASRLS